MTEKRHRGGVLSCKCCMKWCHKFCLASQSSTKSIDEDQNIYTCPSCADIQNKNQHNDNNCYSCNEEKDIIEDILKLVIELMTRFFVNEKKITSID